MAQKQLRSDLLQVKNTFIYHGDQTFRVGQVIAGDHPVVKGREHLFRPFTPAGAPTPPELAAPVTDPAPPAATEPVP